MLLQEMTWPEIGNLSRTIPVVVGKLVEDVIAWDGKSWEMA